MIVYFQTAKVIMCITVYIYLWMVDILQLLLHVHVHRFLQL